ncbi:uncharacterized protein LOC141854464 [Brevipalpus obovatus]|uniref:uncharacterized protein LOC141854464 n=1 Tax=Brevipalpus obovatus TaxID=246614 RepID=UPI003D9DB188
MDDTTSWIIGAQWFGAYFMSLISMFTSVYTRVPTIAKFWFLSMYAVCLIMVMTIMNLLASIVTSKDLKVRNTLLRVLSNFYLPQALRIKILNILNLIEARPVSFSCFHCFKFTKQTLFIALLENASHMLLIVANGRRLIESE